MDHGISNEGGKLVCVRRGGERVGGPGEQQRRHRDPVDAVVWWFGATVFDLPSMGNGVFHKKLQNCRGNGKKNTFPDNELF